MKYVMILYLCSFVNVQPTCYSEKIIGLEFTNYYDCILEGYKQSYQHLASLDKELITKQKLAIKFNCREVKVENI